MDFLLEGILKVLDLYVLLQLDRYDKTLSWIVRLDICSILLIREIFLFDNTITAFFISCVW